MKSPFIKYIIASLLFFIISSIIIILIFSFDEYKNLLFMKEFRYIILILLITLALLFMKFGRYEITFFYFLNIFIAITTLIFSIVYK